RADRSCDRGLPRPAGNEGRVPHRRDSLASRAIGRSGRVVEGRMGAGPAGHAITFMAKWDERHAGSSCHIHMSLWDAKRKRALFEGESEIFRHFLGGWMAHIRELFAFYAPYPASYKRYVAGSFAPTGIAWSHDNRTAGFRIVGHGPSLRIECRVPGADANPYMVYAGVIAAGLDGLERKIEPP